MTGGSVTGNKSPNGGIYVKYLYLGSTPIIKNNTVTGSSVERNVVLLPDSPIWVIPLPTLTDGASVGVTASTPPISGTPVRVTTPNIGGDISAYFFSDDSKYIIQNDKSLNVWLAVP